MSECWFRMAARFGATILEVLMKSSFEGPGAFGIVFGALPLCQLPYLHLQHRLKEQQLSKP